MFLKSSYIVIESRVVDFMYYSPKKMEEKKRKDGMFVPGVGSFILPGWPGVTHSLNTSRERLALQQASEQGDESSLPFLSRQTQGGGLPKESPLASGDRGINMERATTALQSPLWNMKQPSHYLSGCGGVLMELH